MTCRPDMLLRRWLSTIVVAAAWAGRAATGAAADGVLFNRDVRPILSDKCFACHGPDSAKRRAGLRLDVRDVATRPLESGDTAIAPGNSRESELLRRVASSDANEVMPPPDSKLGRLTPAEVATLRQWIDEGARYQLHWAFLPLGEAPAAAPEAGAAARKTGPAPGSGDAPAGVAARGEIDRLVFAKLAGRKMAPQGEADRATLIRRVSFDLTGLPPTPAEVDAYVADADPQAYERLVDRLLASPRYGERMATDWLDVARYADSYGYQVDREREMWPWRDWVIRAFNDNLSWDRFVCWQLAGDLLPGATDEQILATGFNRLHQQESEGGSIEEEYRVNHVNDRVVTFGTAFLGLTLECCRCHDHKFDPLTQKEFYQLFAFFDDIDEAGLYSYFTDATPTPALPLVDAAQKEKMAAAEDAVRASEARLNELREQRREAFDAWLEKRGEAPEALPGELARFAFDERDKNGHFASLVGDKLTASSSPENELVAGKLGQALRLTGDHAVTTTLGNFHRYEPFSVSLWLNTPDVKDRAVVFHRSRAWTDSGSRGYELLIEEGRLKWSLIHFWPGNAASIRAAAPLPPDRWTHVTVTSDGSSRAAGLRLYVDGRPAEVEIVRDGLTKDLTGGGGDTIAIGERFRDRGFKNGLVDDFRVFGRALTPVEAREACEPGSLAALWAKDANSLSAGEREDLAAYYLANVDEPRRAELATLRSARARQSELANAAKSVMVMRELAEPRTAYVLKRGEYQLRQEPVEPGTPAVLPPFPAGAPRNRLGLAQWLTDPANPLLARVTVNRFWQACFGRGLVKTAEDLGSQSDRPEYPELLDWLAGEFIRSGWDVKALMRTIVLSHTYRQRSFSDAAQLAGDPENVWLARGPRHRLAAEMIRDQCLAASGLLVEKIGGPPVRTYDMPESFKPSRAGAGEQLYRRSLYTFWRRTGPAPVLETFDMPKRVVCMARRDTTNTPLQALVLLNGPQFVEAARALAERCYHECHGDRDALLERACLLLTSRRPDAEERSILGRMVDGQRAWYAAHPDEAEAYLKIGHTKRDATLPAPDIAAAASVINALMNFDRSAVKR